MVAANLELGKVKEAAACAREALSVLPRSCLGYLAMALVFSVSQPNSAEVVCAVTFTSFFCDLSVCRLFNRRSA